MSGQTTSFLCGYDTNHPLLMRIDCNNDDNSCTQCLEILNDSSFKMQDYSHGTTYSCNPNLFCYRFNKRLSFRLFWSITIKSNYNVTNSLPNEVYFGCGIALYIENQCYAVFRQQLHVIMNAMYDVKNTHFLR